jgi:integrase
MDSGCRGRWFKTSRPDHRQDSRHVPSTSCQRSLSPDLHDIVVTGIHTGMRLGEILHLQWSDLDFSRMVVNVVSRQEHPTKSRKPRIGPLSEILSDVLHKRLRRLGCPYVFHDGSGNPRRVDTVSRAFSKAVTQEAIPHITFHGRRHAFASWAAMAGGGIPTVGKLVGHSNIATTMRYAHLSPEHLKGAIAFLDGHNLGTVETDSTQRIC